MQSTKAIKPELVDADDLRKIRTRAEHAAAACKDFTPDPKDEVWRYTLQAALGGNDGAAVNFALGLMAGLDTQRPLATLDGWVAYQQFAPLVLQRAIDDGYPPRLLRGCQSHLWPAFRRRNSADRSRPPLTPSRSRRLPPRRLERASKPAYTAFI